jgi:hypothetical protein
MAFFSIIVVVIVRVLVPEEFAAEFHFGQTILCKFALGLES